MIFGTRYLSYILPMPRSKKEQHPFLVDQVLRNELILVRLKIEATPHSEVGKLLVSECLSLNRVNI